MKKLKKKELKCYKVEKDIDSACSEGARIVREIRVAVVTRGTVLVKNRFDRVLGKLLCCCFIEDFDRAIISKRTFNIIFFLLFFVNHYFKYILLKT